MPHGRLQPCKPTRRPHRGLTRPGRRRSVSLASHTGDGTLRPGPSAGERPALRLVPRVLVLLCASLANGCGVPAPTGKSAALPREALAGHRTSLADAAEPLAYESRTDSESGRQFVARVAGELPSAEAVHQFDLGPVWIGDRVQVSATSLSDLDLALGLVDADGDLVLLNERHQRHPEALGAELDLAMRHDSAPCLLVIAASAGCNVGGSYEADITITPAARPVALRPQVVYLDFDGDPAVQVGQRPAIELLPFESHAIVPHLGDTEEFITTLVDMVRVDFQNFDVSVVSSRHNLPPDGEYTTMYFGGWDEQLLGVADNVDEYNQWGSQAAIVFVDGYITFLDADPSPRQLAQAMANTASHEIGHLLGLNHTRNPHDLMSIGLTKQDLLRDQSFLRSPLDESVFRLGMQNGPKLLREITGTR